MLQFCTYYFSFRNLALCAYQYLYLTQDLLRQSCCLEKLMGTASYRLCKEPNCLFVQDPFKVKLFSLKLKKNAYSVVKMWKKKCECCIRDG